MEDEWQDSIGYTDAVEDEAVEEPGLEPRRHINETFLRSLDSTLACACSCHWNFRLSNLVTLFGEAVARVRVLIRIDVEEVCEYAV